MHLPPGSPPSESTLEIDATFWILREFRQRYPQSIAISPTRDAENDLGWDIGPLTDHNWGRVFGIQFKRPRKKSSFPEPDIGQMSHLNGNDWDGSFLKYRIDVNQLETLQRNPSEVMYYGLPTVCTRLALPSALQQTLFVDANEFPPATTIAQETVRLGVPTWFAASHREQLLRKSDVQYSEEVGGIHAKNHDIALHLASDHQIPATALKRWPAIRRGIFDDSVGEPADNVDKLPLPDGGPEEPSKSSDPQRTTAVQSAPLYILVHGSRPPDQVEGRGLEYPPLSDGIGPTAEAKWRESLGNARKPR